MILHNSQLRRLRDSSNLIDLLKTNKRSKVAQNYDNVIYCNVAPPFKDLKLFDETEIVYHACEWDRNYLDQEKTDRQSRYVDENEFKY